MTDGSRSAAPPTFEGAGIAYTVSWEDPRGVLSVLADCPDGPLLAVCGAGTAALELWARTGRSLVCVDLNPLQLGLTQFYRLAALAGRLDELVAPRSGDPRPQLACLANDLRLTPPVGLETVWHSELDRLNGGLILEGRLERRLLKLFRRLVGPTILSSGSADLEAVRARLAESGTLRAIAFKAFCANRRAEHLSRREREAAVDSGLGALQRQLSKPDWLDNPYLTLPLGAAGMRNPDPPFPLWPDAKEHIRDVEAPFQTIACNIFSLNPPPARYAGAVLSNLFAYLSQAEVRGLLLKLRPSLLQGGLIVAWDREPAADISGIDGYEVDTEASRLLVSEDRTWINSRSVVLRAC